MATRQSIGNIALDGPTKEQSEEQLQRIVGSETFRNATTLQRLLKYLGSKATEDPPAEVKEYTIGMDVFERGPDYDPKIDTVARVQIHRLRVKIKEYYETEGSRDPILVEVPRGHYLPSFEIRSAVIVDPDSAASTNGTLPAPTPGDLASGKTVASGEARGQKRHRRVGASRTRKAAMVSAAVLLYALGLLMGNHWKWNGIFSKSDLPPVAAQTVANTSGNAAHTFWASFLRDDNAPVVGYADAVYLLDGADDLFRFRRGASDDRGTLVEPHLALKYAASPALVAKAGPLYYEDGYTGTGDVESIFAITRLFTEMSLQMTVKRCRLVTIDDLRQHDIILLGSPAENDAVAQLPQISDFVWNHPNVAGPWMGEFVNRHPQPGESLTYKTERDPDTQEVKADYGLITVQPGLVPGRYIAILGGLDTAGVAGTAQFMTSPSQMAELQKRLESLGAWTDKTQPPIFQALLRVDVERGHDVLTVHLITVHVATPEKADALTSAKPRDKNSRF
jgi:hypothetical protein